MLAAIGQGKWNPGNNALPRVRFCLIAHLLPERVIYALSDATFGYRIRNATYRSVAEIKELTAGRDLKQLVDAGLLVPTGERRGRVYAASELLLAIRERNREPRSAYKSAL